ncbi:MAG TPA: phosphatase PAP2 family protein [Terriglobales bacterium]|nr:phosphatase PAP2 family protein [Terriglobales bacterium]
MPLSAPADYITSGCDLQLMALTPRRRHKCSVLGAIALIGLALIVSDQVAAQSTVPDAPSAVVGLAAIDPLGNFEADPPDAPPHSSFRQLVRRGLKDQREIYTAPFRRSAVKWDIAVIAVTGGLIAADRHISGQISSSHLNVSRDISDAGLYGALGAVGASWLSGAVTDNAHARETGFLGAEALANSAAVYAVINVITGRQRPLEGNGKGHFFQNNTLDSSFPSGHAILTWSGAAVLAHEYPKSWVKWLAYGTATAVSVTRVTGKEHFPADVVVGSTFGYLIGRHIFRSHCKPGLSAACEIPSHTP